MTRTTIRLSDDLLRRAKKKAAEKGQTFTSLVEEGLKAVLTEPKQPPRKGVRLPVSKASGGTLPGIDLTRSAELEDRMDLT